MSLEKTDSTNYKEIQQQLKMTSPDKINGEFTNNLLPKNFELIGFGTESVVIAAKTVSKNDLGKINTVIALDYRESRSPLEAKKCFYTQRIMSTLFPHNFPQFRIVYGSDSQNKFSSGSFREKIDLLKANPEANRYGHAKYPFTTVEHAIRQLNLPVGIDGAECNFGLSSDGGIYYLDSLHLREHRTWDKNVISEYLEKNKYPRQSVDIIFKSINRLNQLTHTE